MSTVQIPLRSRKHPGLFAIIDEEDFDRVAKHRWSPLVGHRSASREPTYYAMAIVGLPDGTARKVRLHRYILGVPDGVMVDHEDSDGLNCTRANLREATSSQNHQNNRKHAATRASSQYKGVSWNAKRERWTAFAVIEGRNKYLGLYVREEDAARAYDAAARLQYGHFARLNFPDEDKPWNGEIPKQALARSGYRGVTLNYKRWAAAISIQGRDTFLGNFDTPEEAARVYDQAAREHHGEAARLNFPD